MPDRVVLRGNDVELVPIERSHSPELLEAASEDRSHYAYTFVPATIDEADRMIDYALAAEADGTGLGFVVRSLSEGRIVGTTRFMEFEFWEDCPATDSPQAVSIGATWYSHSAQRTSTNTECKLLLLTHAFEVWRVERVSLQTDVRNVRSRRAIERIGGQLEGIRRSHRMATDGTIRDSAIYSIVREEWDGVQHELVRRLRDG